MFLIFVILSQELITLHFNENHNIFSMQRIEVNYRNVSIGTNPLSDLLLFPNLYVNYRYGQFQGGLGAISFSGSSVYRSLLGFDELDADLFILSLNLVYRSKIGLVGLKFSNSSNYRNIGIVYGNQYKGLLYEVGYNTDYGVMFHLGFKKGERLFLTAGFLYPGIDFIVRLPVIPYLNIGIIQKR